MILGEVRRAGLVRARSSPGSTAGGWCSCATRFGSPARRGRPARRRGRDDRAGRHRRGRRGRLRRRLGGRRGGRAGLRPPTTSPTARRAGRRRRDRSVSAVVDRAAGRPGRCGPDAGRRQGRRAAPAAVARSPGAGRLRRHAPPRSPRLDEAPRPGSRRRCARSPPDAPPARSRRRPPGPGGRARRRGRRSGARRGARRLHRPGPARSRCGPRRPPRTPPTRPSPASTTPTSRCGAPTPSPTRCALLGEPLHRAGGVLPRAARRGRDGGRRAADGDGPRGGRVHDAQPRQRRPLDRRLRGRVGSRRAAGLRRGRPRTGSSSTRSAARCCAGRSPTSRPGWSAGPTAAPSPRTSPSRCGPHPA